MILEIPITSVKMIVGGLRMPTAPYHNHLEKLFSGLQGWTVAEVAELILSKTFRFYVEDSSGCRAYLEVINPGLLGGRTYVRTQPDSTKTDNLYALPGGPLYRPMTFVGGIIGNAIQRR